MQSEGMTENKTPGQVYWEQIENKVTEIIPLLNGLSINQIEDVVNKVSEFVKTKPITV